MINIRSFRKYLFLRGDSYNDYIEKYDIFEKAPCLQGASLLPND
ncbi:hypothetical protein EMIT079MI2_990001 [Bacillus sp. IT-79MI2]